jgi:putative ABC transport system substrate-binding protein
MAQDSDPVGNGFVASLARPGGNITGLSTVASEMSGKQIELLCPSAEAQQPKKLYRIGYLTVASSRAQASRIEVFRKKLHELGYVEGQNILIEERSAAGVYERLPDLATDLMRLRVDVILSGGTSATRAAQKATSLIPTIMANSTDDPVSAGFVANLAQPGGNITGLSSVSTDLSGKRPELLKEVLPKAARAAVLLNADNPGHVARFKEIDVVGRELE